MRPPGKVHFTHDTNPSGIGDDPHISLRVSGDLSFPSPDQCELSGDALDLFRTCDRMLREFALSNGACEENYPNELPAEIVRKTGFIANFPNLVQQVKNSADLVYAPTVCCHTFHRLSGHQLDRGQSITAVGTCRRQEGKGNLERLSAFTMREIVHVGTEDSVQRFRQQVLDFFATISREWNLKSRVVSAEDPFFVAEKRAFQSALDLKQELQLFLPYSQQWLAVASLNWHISSMVRAFQLTAKADAPPLQSACVGFGLERLTLALYAQWGDAKENWPRPFQGL